MLKPLRMKSLALTSAVMLAACGGATDEPSSSASSVSSVSSQPSSNSSVSSSSISSSVMSSSSADSNGLSLSANGDAALGEQLWAANCLACHGTPGDGYVTDGFYTVNAVHAVGSYDAPGGFEGYNGLQYYIHYEMPANGGWAKCTDDCAVDVAAYIRSWLPDTTAASCDDQDPVTYGERSLKLLSSSQYQNAVEDLLGVNQNYGAKIANNDGTIGGFPNMNHRSISGQIADIYLANAEDIAVWAIANNKPFSCTDGQVCGTRFVDEFAYQAFRRPLTSAERSAYLELFAQYSATEAMELAITAALSSPQFLYRSEVGVDVATALLSGYYSNSGGDGASTYVSNGQRTTVRAVNFSDLSSVGGNGGLEGEGDLAGTLGFNIWSNGSISHTFNQTLPSVTVIDVEAKGTPLDDTWPEMSVLVGGQTIGKVTVNSNTYTTYTFVADGLSGTSKIEINFANDEGRDPYDVYGNDRNLLINGISISTGVVAAAKVPESNPLDQADADAYVLTPYEFASALSFMFTGSTPDIALLTAAKNDQLSTPEQIEAQIQRLISSDRGQQHFGEFAGLWLRTNEVTRANRDAVADFTPAVKQAMAQEVKELFKYVFNNDDVPFSEFYSGDYTLLNNTLATFYGIAGNFGEAFTKVNTTTRGGIITTGAFMAVNAHNERTSPIKRAVRVRELMLCHHIDPPNAELDGDRAAAQMQVEAFEQANGGIDSRSFYELYTQDSACAGCHESIINPMFGMEDFDNVGRLRAPAGNNSVYEVLANGREMAVSLQGSLIGVESVKDPTTLNYAGTKDLSKKLAGTDAIQSCLVRKGFRFVTGLPSSPEDVDKNVKETLTPEQQQDYACASAKMKDALMQNGESPKAMFGELGKLELIRFRK